jgi:predicted dehydrogenase
MKTIRWGMIGCGDVTELKSGPAFQKARNSALTAVMRRNGDLARDYASRHHVPAWYDSAEALIADPQVDAVYVATPPAHHKEYTLRAAMAGKPVYVEKPMALNERECLEMIEACRAANVPLFVAYYRRALPRFLKVKEIVESGILGEIRFVTVTLYEPVPQDLNPTRLPWRLIPEIAGGGLFADLACHTLDFLDFVFGPIRTTTGAAINQAGCYSAEDLVSGTFVFECGVVCSGLWCFSGYAKVDRNEIVGTKGKLTFSTFGTEPVQVATEKGAIEIPAETPPHVQQPLIQSIVDELNGTGRCPSHGESALRTTRVMDTLLGRAPIGRP